MSWKDWPYWKKGGLIGLFVYLLLMIMLRLSPSILYMLIFLFAFIQIKIFPATSHSQLRFMYIVGMVLLATPLGYLIIGGLIGLVVGKIKSARQNKL